MVYFFSKEEKRNSLALTDCVNAFVFCFALLFFVFFFRLAGILQLRKKAGESSCFFFVILQFPSPEFSCVRWVGKCSIKNLLGSSSSFLPSNSYYCKALSLISQQLNCLTVPAFCRHYADKGAIVSYKVHMYYPCLFHFQLYAFLMTAKEDSPVRLSLLDSFYAAFKTQ